MRFWFSRTGQVSIREQLVTQVMLGILGGDLAAGQKLPSTRELARRYNLHSNTVSSAYKELEKQGWVELRHGSGIYVRSSKPESPLHPSLVLDQAIGALFRTAREQGTPFEQVRARLEQWLSVEPPDHFVLIETDEELRAIVKSEIAKVTQLPVEVASVAECKRREVLDRAIPVCLPSKADAVRKLLPAGAELVVLPVRSVPVSLAAWIPAKREVLLTIVSRWTGFLDSARTMLVAAGFDAEALILRDARKAGWRRSLNGSSAVICDSLTAKSIKHPRVIVFPILAENMGEVLKSFEEFVSAPR